MTDRPTILLLPGNMCDARMWDELMPALAGWPVERPALRQDTIVGMARHCLAMHEGQIVPVGFSMGAIVALAIADLAPERIAAMGLIDVNAGADRPERAAMRPRQQREVLGGQLDRVVMEELKPGYFAAVNRRDQPMRSLVLAMARDLGPEVFAAQSEALRTREDYRHVPAALGKPVLLACGEEDALCPPASHAELAATIASAELHIVPGAGHLLPIEQPARLGALLSSWLTRNDEEITCQAVS